VFVERETGGNDVFGRVSLRLDPEVSVVLQADVVVGEVGRLERVVARVERISVQDEGRIQPEER